MKPYRVMEVGRSAVDHLVRKHYLHSWPGVVTAILAMLDGPTPIGCIVFALPPRETMVRYGGVQTWELARLFIEDVTPKNAETWFVARAIRWIRLNHQEVRCLVSYADPSAHHEGTIYKAGNWIQDGRTDQERRSPRIDYAAEVTEPQSSLFGSDPKPLLVKFSRRSHVPADVDFKRVPRVSKHRFVYWLDGEHEKRRTKGVA